MEAPADERSPVTWTCPVCHQTGPLVLRGPREVTVGTVAVAVERTPVVACPAGHEATPPALVDASMAAVGEGVVRARSRLLRGDRCRACGAALTMPVRRTQRPVTVEHPDAPVLTLRFDLPATRCPDCGTDQVPSRSQEDLVVSVPALFAGTGRDG